MVEIEKFLQKWQNYIKFIKLKHLTPKFEDRPTYLPPLTFYLLYFLLTCRGGRYETFLGVMSQISEWGALIWWIWCNFAISEEIFRFRPFLTNCRDFLWFSPFPTPPTYLFLGVHKYSDGIIKPYRFFECKKTIYEIEQKSYCVQDKRAIIWRTKAIEISKLEPDISNF